MPEQRLNVPAAAQHAKNEHIFVLDAVDDDVLADRLGRITRSLAFVTAVEPCLDN